ncbi:MAG: hypothetical protein COT91_02730 [Candidatus Doudnabacteria bacterium CG10_big_fil_rev_8_21_14_0_10_41_10]|uniref:Uncharacterized protein n=1 Tax=Candidatus Doudnabacteria bacterium CG10_big_fil_rev_8_21_14_0_10_41_10 TaxID=1974551 RepID=A0A2H0VDL5_9BACT|nr:MAG: hypothetical protein COT91_02730 [Candidatus Doudnabacteria bacterium CG10_big_fil_rev_8_21_14_0_10_41_10]
MSNQTTKTKADIQNDIHNLRKEVSLMRSLLISLIGRDQEGSYKPSFVKAVLKSAQEKSNFKFSNSRSLLSDLKKV